MQSRFPVSVKYFATLIGQLLFHNVIWNLTWIAEIKIWLCAELSIIVCKLIESSCVRILFSSWIFLLCDLWWKLCKTYQLLLTDWWAVVNLCMIIFSLNIIDLIAEFFKNSIGFFIVITVFKIIISYIVTFKRIITFLKMFSKSNYDRFFYSHFFVIILKALRIS